MIDVILFVAGAAGGYVLSAYTWPTLRTLVTGLEQEIAQVKTRAAALEAKLRAVVSSQT